MGSTLIAGGLLTAAVELLGISSKGVDGLGVWRCGYVAECGKRGWHI